ncbi:MAG: hypothetical protein QNJ98_01655 [Planctomycetota bacterium]|nr:hypothetical protein [Planctomycetota bacterium]
MSSRWMTAFALLATAGFVLGGCYSRSAAEERRASASGTADAPAMEAGGTMEPMAKMPAAEPASADVKAMSSRFGRPGFAVYEEDGRLWVFKVNSKAHDTFRAKGEPAKSVTKIGVGPDRMSVRGADGDVIDSYVHAVKYGKPGFAVFGEDGRLWVFKLGSENLTSYLETGEPAKSVTKVGAGPDGKTLRGAESEVLDAYRKAWGLGSTPAPAPLTSMNEGGRSQSGFYGRPGFSVYEAEGRLWVFKTGSNALETFLTKGEPAKSVTRIGAGPNGKTIRGAEGEVLSSYADAWKYGRPGFAVFGDDGRLWVFRSGSEALQTYLEKGEPAKSVTRIGVGPDRKTVRSSDGETIDAYLRAVR